MLSIGFVVISDVRSIVGIFSLSNVSSSSKASSRESAADSFFSRS